MIRLPSHPALSLPPLLLLVSLGATLPASAQESATARNGASVDAVEAPQRERGAREDAAAAAVVPAPVAGGLLPGEPWSVAVAVGDRGVDEQREAWALAMRAVLLANSGDKTLLNRDDVRAGLRDAESYVERFDYRTPSPGTRIASGTPLTDAVRRTGEATQLMVVRFARERLEALIRRDDSGAEVADETASGASEDPFADIGSALLWLLIEDGRREIMISDPAARNVRARAREIAGSSGLTLLYPNGDEADRAALDASDIREARLDRVRLASERYAVPAVLIGRLGRDGLSAWEGVWTKFVGESVANERFTSDSLDEALQAGIGWLSEAAGDDSYRYGGEAVSDTEALVWVGPLDSVSAYATVMNFLQGVPGVGTVYPKEVDERGMAFAVVPRGALPSIAAAAADLNWLRRTTPPSDRPGDVVWGELGPGDSAPRGADTRFGTAAGGAPSGDGGSTAASGANVAVGSAAMTDGSRASGGTGVSSVPTRTGSLARNAELAFDYLR